jgi:sec-independent protein translocase protein TatB
MPQIGWFELLLIVIIAILVIGPKDFPIVLKKIGSWIGTIKNYFSEVQQNVNEITDLKIDDEKESKNKNKVENEHQK